MRMPKRRENLSTKLTVKIGLVILLFLMFVADIIWKAYEISERETVLGTEEKNVVSEKENLILNLEEFATPLLEDDAFLLNERLEKYVEGMGRNVSSAEIFYVILSEKENDCFDFYVKLLPGDEIVKLTFDYKDSSVVAGACEYTEEEIRNEIWNGGAPPIRDLQ